MPGQLPPQCPRHVGFVAGKCGRCQIELNPSLATSERTWTSSQRKHWGRTSEEAAESRAEYERAAAQRRADYEAQDAERELRGRSR
jgi:hypothetical protein